MRPDLARRIVQLAAMVTVEAILLWVVPLSAWITVPLCWVIVFVAGLHWFREDHPKPRRRKRVGPRAEWID
jgi:hypothetical protein